MLAALLGLALVHAAPTGVVLCASENGLRFEFACNCNEHESGQACGCGDTDCSDALAVGQTASCACSDHSIQLAGARSVDIDGPAVEQVATVSVFAAAPLVPKLTASAVASHYVEAPPPLLQTRTVVLLI